MPDPITRPVYGPPNRVTCNPQVGVLKVMTMYDPTVGGQAVTVTLNGVTYTSGVNLTLTGYGSPSPIVWTGDITPGDLPFAGYPWTISQTVSGKTWTDSGTYWPTPKHYNDFRTILTGCDNNTVNANTVNNTRPQTVPGWWQHAARRAQAALAAGDVPYSHMIRGEDNGYVNLMQVRDNYDIYVHANQSGLTFTGVANANGLNGYLIGWMAILGMLGPEQTEYTDEELGSAVQLLYVLWGREVNRAWCRKNMTALDQMGDQEFLNDLFWSTNNATPNPRWQSLGVDGVAMQAWDAFFISSGNVSNRDANTRAWAVKLGALCVFAPDRISSAVGNTGVTYSPPTTGMTQLGQNQIFDVLDAVQAKQCPFNLGIMSLGFRYYGAGPNYGLNTYGSQHALYNHALVEFQEFLTKTGQTPKSIMDHDWTKGKLGSTFFMAVDHHFGQWLKFKKAAYSGNAAENWHVIQVGSTNSSAPHQSTELTEEGQTLADIECLYAEKFHDSIPNLSGRHFHGAVIEVYGERNPKECHVYLCNHFDDVKMSRKWVQYHGNDGYAIEAVVSAPAQTVLAPGAGLI